MWIETPNPDKVLATGILGEAILPRSPETVEPYDPSHDYGFGSAFGAAFLRENTVLSAYHAFVRGDQATAQDLIDGKASNHNPYRFLRQTYDAKTLERLAPAINAGEFEGSVSDRMARAIAEDVLYELDLQDRMAGSGAGALFGSLATSFVDPTTYIPFVGSAYKTGRLGKVGLFALNAALSAGVSEAALQATQRERSLQESILNIGTAGIIGGGLGLFASALAKGEHNPLRSENVDRQGEVVRTADGHAKDELSHEELSTLRDDVEGAGASAGAAYTGNAGFDTRIAIGEPKGPVGRTVRKVGDFFNSKTIVGRVVRATSPIARRVGLSLMDPGGILLKGHLAGKTMLPSAEAIKKDFMSEVDQLYAGLTQNTTKLNMDVAKAGGRKIDHADVLLATQRRLFGMEDKELDDTLTAKYGEDALPRIKAAADANASEINRLNAVWEDRLVKEGLLQNQPKVTALKSELDALRTQIDTHVANEATTTVGPKRPPATPEQEAELTRLRNRRDFVRGELQTELGKATPLGDKYGHAQLWNREAIIESPEDFKSFLLDALSLQPDPEWLSSVHGLIPDDLEKLRQTDLSKYRAILSDWAGDDHYWRITQTEHRLAAAKEAEKSARLDLRQALAAVGQAERREASVTLSEARTRRDKVAARLAEMRAERQQLDAERRALIEAATAARGHTLDALRRDEPTTAEVRRDRLVVANADREANLQTALEDTLSDPATPRDAGGKPRFQDAGDVAQLTEGVAKGNRQIVDTHHEINTDVDNVSVDTARTQGRVQEISRRLHELDRQLETLSARSEELDAKLRMVEDHHEDVTAIRRDLEDYVRQVRVDRKIAEKDLRAVKKALRKVAGQTPLEDMVDEIYRRLTTTGDVGAAIMDRINEVGDRTTGRVKQRAITLGPTQRIEGVKRGWLKDDLSAILYHQYDQLSAELGIRQGVGIGPNRQFESWADVTRTVDEEYNQMIADAPDKKAKDLLRKEKKVMLDDLVEGRARLKGTYDDDGTTFGWIKWGSAKMRQANFIRYGGGFLLSSLTDMATVALRHGGIIRLLRENAGPAVRELRNAYKEAPSELQSFISSVELGMGAAASARRYGNEDLIHGAYANYGIGFGRTRRVTGAIDKGLDKVGHAVATYSGLPLWNRFWKTVAGLGMSKRLNEMVRRYDSLSPAEVADLASLGIGKSEAERLAGFLKDHGKVSDGRFDPHMELWGDSDAALAASRDFRLAITRDMDRAINTPGVGDTPRLMSKWQARLLLQFQTFAFTFINRYAYPVVQRASMFRERQAFMSMGLLFAASAFVMLGHDVINGRNPMDRFTEDSAIKTIHELIDRSGFLGWTSPYTDSFLKATGSITGYNGTNRYARNDWVASMLGINYALLKDVERAGSAALDGDPKVLSKLLVLAPFNTQARLLYNQFIDR